MSILTTPKVTTFFEVVLFDIDDDSKQGCELVTYLDVSADHADNLEAALDYAGYRPDDESWRNGDEVIQRFLLRSNLPDMGENLGSEDYHQWHYAVSKAQSAVSNRVSLFCQEFLLDADVFPMWSFAV